MRRRCLFGLLFLGLFLWACGDDSDLSQAQDGLGEGDRLEDPDRESEENPAGLDAPGTDEDDDEGHDDCEVGCGDLGWACCGERDDCEWEGGDGGACYPDEAEPPACEAGCGDLGWACCGERDDCEWEGGDGGACFPAGEVEPPTCEAGCGDLGWACCGERDDCEWEGGDGGACYPDEAEPPACEAGCGDLAWACCGERDDCEWEGGDGGACFPAGEVEPPTCEAGCGDLGWECCGERDDCEWEGGDGGACFPAGEVEPPTCEAGCGDLGWECCGERDDCAWYMGDAGFCAAAGEPPCHEFNQPWCREFPDACVWHEGEEHCFYADEVEPPPTCEAGCGDLGWECCGERDDCAWYMGDAGFCAAAGEPPCHEFNEPWCSEFPEVCTWVPGEEHCFYADEVEPPPTCEAGCGDLGWECCGERDDCAWYMGDAGFCAAAGEPPCHEFNEPWCSEFPEVCAWVPGEEHCFYADEVEPPPTCVAGCGDLGWECCGERDDCAWYMGDDGFCAAAGDPPCGELNEAWCSEFAEACVWIAGEEHCFDASDVGDPCEGDCIGQSGACCDERAECAWYMGDAGFCAGAEHPPCGELDAPWCSEFPDSCVWIEGEEHCFDVDDIAEICAGDCFGLSGICCEERAACAWYMGDEGLCAGAEQPPCGELNEPWCGEFPDTCVWHEGEAHCFHVDDIGAVCEGPCWELDGGCCAERAACAWYMGEDGFCASAEEPPCGELGFEWCLETEGCTWHEGEEWCIPATGG